MTLPPSNTTEYKLIVVGGVVLAGVLAVLLVVTLIAVLDAIGNFGEWIFGEWHRGAVAWGVVFVLGAGGYILASPALWIAAILLGLLLAALVCLN
jgi:hypothetical protein